jgi:transposase
MSEHITIGMDLGDRHHIIVVFDNQGNEIATKRIANTKLALRKYFQRYATATVAIEAGTHSPWISRELQQLGLVVYVGNPRKLRLIWDSHDKSDERDARILAMVCRVEPRLLWPVKHRNVQAYNDLEVIKARDMLVQTRTKLINHVRCVVKSHGERLPGCSAQSFAKRVAELLPAPLSDALSYLVETIADMTQRICDLEHKIEQLSTQRYPETQRLRQVAGVGPTTALTYVLTIEDPSRFRKSRMVGAYLGLTPRRDQSGASDKQLRISKAGNGYLRRLLVNCAHYILGRFGPDCDLRRFALAIAARGGKNAKKRAAVAVARKLAVLLHRLWASQQSYEPFYAVVSNRKAA